MSHNNQEEQSAPDNVLDEFFKFQPVISQEDITRLEKCASNKNQSKQRRLCLPSCSKSAETLGELSISNPEEFAEMLEAVEDFNNHARMMAEVSESAFTL